MDSLSGNDSINSHNTDITYLEHVVVKVTLALSFNDDRSYSYDKYYNAFYGDYDLGDILSHDYARRGDISITLRSPQGTVSVLLPTRQRDFVNTLGYEDWEFMSVHFWGENPQGNWELVTSYKSEVGSVTVSDISVKLYGTDSIPQSVQETSTDCNSDDCSHRCSHRDSKELCHTCKNKRDSQTLICLTECPANYTEISDYCINPNNSNNVSIPNSLSHPVTTASVKDPSLSSIPSTTYSIRSTSTVITSSSYNQNINPSSTVLASDTSIGIVDYTKEDYKASAIANNPRVLLLCLIITISQVLLIFLQ